MVESAAAASWSPRAAAACALDRLMDPPPFAAKAEAGSSAAITIHKTKRMMTSVFDFHVNARGLFRMQRQRG
jgi:hypothetical protein